MARFSLRITASPTLHLKSDEIQLCLPLSGVSNDQQQELPPIPEAKRDKLLNRIKDVLVLLQSSNHNPDWWYLPVSEVQPNMSLLLPALELEVQIEELIEQFPNKKFVISIPNEMMGRYLIDCFRGRENINVYADFRDRCLWTYRSLKRSGFRYLNIFLWLLEKSKHLKAQEPAKKIENQKVDYLFVSRLEADCLLPQESFFTKEWHDRYLGSLLEECLEADKKIVLLARPGVDPVGLSRTAGRWDRFDLFTTFQMISSRDLFQIVRRCLAFRLEIEDQSPLSELLYKESRNQLCALADCMLVEAAVDALTDPVKPEKVISMQENSVWEYGVIQAVRKKKLPAQLVGYFHCPIMPNALRYHHDERLHQRPMFDAIIPLGEEMRQSLCSLGPWPHVLPYGYGFRNPDIEACYDLQHRSGRTVCNIVILLGGMFDNGTFLKWVVNAVTPVSDVKILIKGHPVYGSHKAVVDAGISLGGDIEDISHLSLSEAMAEADIIVYKGTTACLSSLAAGIPVIHVDHGGVQTDDTLFNAQNLKCSCSRPEDFRTAIGKYREMPTSQKEAWRVKAKKYVESYYDLSEKSRNQVLDFIFSDTPMS